MLFRSRVQCAKWAILNCRFRIYHNKPLQSLDTSLLFSGNYNPPDWKKDVEEATTTKELPDFNLIRQEKDRDTERFLMLAGLSPKQKAVIIGRFIEGKTIAEIARETKVSKQAVYPMLKNALKKLSYYIRKNYDDKSCPLNPIV